MIPSPPLLSLCIPTYNRWELLRQTLESILVGVRKLPEDCGWEILVSDNASSDGTAECPQQFPETRGVRYYRRESNTYAMENLFYVCAQARGKFLWLLGDDDPMFPEAPQRLVELIQRNTLDYVFVPRVLVNRDLSPHPCGLQPGVALRGCRTYDSGKALFADRDTEFGRLMGFFGCNVIRRDVWEESKAILERSGMSLLEDPWGHVRIILYAIRDLRCAMMDVPGVRCRLNPSRIHADSRVWLDEGVRLLQQAQRWGYPSEVIGEEICFCFRANAAKFVANKARGQRRGTLSQVVEELQCGELVTERDFWVLLSRLPARVLNWLLLGRRLFARFRTSFFRAGRRLRQMTVGQ